MAEPRTITLYLLRDSCGGGWAMQAVCPFLVEGHGARPAFCQFADPEDETATAIELERDAEAPLQRRHPDCPFGRAEVRVTMEPVAAEPGSGDPG